VALSSQIFVECKLTLRGHLADIAMKAMLRFGSASSFPRQAL
jgi:hypothetical protein